MKCELCKRGPLSAPSVPVFRINPKGVKGIWRCWNCLTPEQKATVETDVKDIVDTISPPTEAA